MTSIEAGPVRQPFALRLAPHFLHRVKERFSDVTWTEGSILRELEAADWYPAGGRAFYAVRRSPHRVVVFVVDIRDGLLDLMTVYMPRPEWARRLEDARPWPFSVVAALST